MNFSACLLYFPRMKRECYPWFCGQRHVVLDTPWVMGIVNVTPDSFYGGSRVPECSAAVSRGLQMVADGAKILDIGGESTRPGATPVTQAEECARVIPVIEALRSACPQLILSVDTRHTATAAAAIAAGADVINDVAACTPDAGMWELIASSGAGYILMHARGTPQTMDQLVTYEDVVASVLNTLVDRAQTCMALGVKREQIVLDPGLGFAKTAHDSLVLLASTAQFAAWGPTLIAASRKRFLGDLTRRAVAEERQAASVGAALAAVAQGAALVRVHDVRETVDALNVFLAVQEVAQC